MMKRVRPYFASILTISLLGLTACERETYTTWSCKNFEGDKNVMILKKAQMQFLGKNLNYCGSLGNKSYFDINCPAQIENANLVFIPSNGSLLTDSKNYQCDAL